MTTSQPALPSPAARRREYVLRAINTLIPVVLIAGMLFAAIPRDWLGEAIQARHDRMINAMRKLSLSQNWSMYAPNPSRGHFYLELQALDAEGQLWELEESERVDWGTAWVWTKDREDIWLHAVGRRADTINRNRTWYLRGVCVREARRGHDIRRVEANRVERSIRSPEQVRDGAPLLGPERRQKAQDSSCRVQIIRDMIEYDRSLRGEGEAGEP